MGHDSDMPSVRLNFSKLNLSSCRIGEKYSSLQIPSFAADVKALLRRARAEVNVGVQSDSI